MLMGLAATWYTYRYPIIFSDKYVVIIILVIFKLVPLLLFIYFFSIVRGIESKMNQQEEVPDNILLLQNKRIKRLKFLLCFVIFLNLLIFADQAHSLMLVGSELEIFIATYFLSRLVT